MIERDEVKRLLAALLQENPAIDLDDEEIDDIVDQASGHACADSSYLCIQCPSTLTCVAR